MAKLIMMFLGMNLLLAGCSAKAPIAENKPGTIKREKVIRVQQGTVTAIKNVLVQGEKSKTGSTVGSLTGSVLGASTVPYVGSLVGSMVGGAVGSSADDELSRKPGVEITLRLESGELVTVTQLVTTKFKTGDKVKLVLQDNHAQVIHSPTI